MTKETSKRVGIYSFLCAITTALLRFISHQIYCDLSHFHFSIDLLGTFSLMPMALVLKLIDGTSVKSCLAKKRSRIHVGLLSLGYMLIVIVCVVNAYGSFHVASLNYKLGTKVASVADYHRLTKHQPTSRLTFAKPFGLHTCPTQDLTAIWRRSPATFQLSHRTSAAFDNLVGTVWVAQAVLWLLAFSSFILNENENNNNIGSTPQLTHATLHGTPFLSSSLPSNDCWADRVYQFDQLTEIQDKNIEMIKI